MLRSKGFQCLTCVTSKWHLSSTKNNRAHLVNIGYPLIQVWDSTMFLFLRYCVYNFFRLSPLEIPNDLWPSPKPLGIIYSIWSIKYDFHPCFPLEILFLQGFQILTSGHFKWPLTPTKTKGVIYSIWLMNMLSMRSLIVTFVVVTRFWPFDHWWPQMTFDLH